MSRPRLLSRKSSPVVPRTAGEPEKPEFKWRDALVDAVIIGGMSAVSALAGLRAADIQADPFQASLSLAVSFFGPFLATLAIRRGIKR